MALNIDQQKLLSRMRAIHGTVDVVQEAGGLHARFASPAALIQDGLSELKKRHGYLNLDKALGIAPVVQTRKTKKATEDLAVGLCMKTGTVYSLRDLLAMRPLEQRGIKRLSSPGVTRDETYDGRVKDEHGVLVSPSPGECVPLSSIHDPDHPVMKFLTARNVSPESLSMFAPAFCTQAAPEDQDHARYYRRMPGQFFDCPGGRLILYALVGGSKVAWQARFLDLTLDNEKYGLHPGTLSWVRTHTRENPEAPWVIDPALVIPNSERTFSPSKYRNAWDMRRNEILFGLDAAVNLSRLMPETRRHCFLVEGPFDAARLGPGAIAYVGKHIAPAQAKNIAWRFRTAFLIPDNDKAGRETLQTNVEHLQAAGVANVRVCTSLPDKFKDVGEMPQGEAIALRKSIIQNL